MDKVSFVEAAALTLPTRPTLGELEAMMVRATRFYMLRGCDDEAERERWCAKARQWAADINAAFDERLGNTW